MDRLLSGQRVLVVEDEFLVLMHMEDMLADLGCDAVTSAATVTDALSLIDTKTFDLAMLDMNLDGDKTDAVADALAEHGVPFAFATGYSSPDMKDCHRDRPVLNKPIGNGRLVETLSFLLLH